MTIVDNTSNNDCIFKIISIINNQNEQAWKNLKNESRELRISTYESKIVNEQKK